MIEIAQKDLLDLRVTLAEQGVAALGTAVDHQHAALLWRARGIQRVGVVEDHVERIVRRQNRIQVVPRHRLTLARADAHHDMRTEGDAIDRRAETRRHGIGHERDQVRSWHGDNRRASPHAACPIGPLVAHRHAGAVEGKAHRPRVESDLVGEVAPHRLGQEPRATTHVAAEVARVPDVPKQRRHCRHGDLPRLGDRAIAERAKNPLGLGVQRAKKVGERFVAAVLQETQPYIRCGLARLLDGESHVLIANPLDLEARAGERDATTQREWQLEGHQLRAGILNHTVLQREIEHRARDLEDVEAVLRHQTTDHRIGRREHVSTNRHRQLAALLRPDAPADTIRRLEDQWVVRTQFARGGQAGDASANDDHVAFFGDSHALSLVVIARRDRCAAPIAVRCAPCTTIS